MPLPCLMPQCIRQYKGITPWHRQTELPGREGSIMGRRSAFSLMDKYLQEEGEVYLSGIQALVRLPVDQHRADRRAGLKTATFISGYRGSPLGGLDLTLERLPDLLREYHIHFASGVNE